MKKYIVLYPHPADGFLVIDLNNSAEEGYVLKHISTNKYGDVKFVVMEREVYPTQDQVQNK